MKKIKVQEKQEEIKFWLKKIGLSQNKFAELFYDEYHENSFDEDLNSFRETFKKQMSRTSTKIELLETYLSYLFTTEKFKEAGYRKPQPVSSDILSPETVKMMKSISQELTEKFEL